MRKMHHFLKAACAVLLTFALATPTALAADGAKQTPGSGKIAVQKAPVKKEQKLKIKDGVTLPNLKTYKAGQDEPQLNALGLVEPEAANNHDPNNAIGINLDTTYQDTITAEGMENWYFVNAATAGKLTVIMQAVNNPAIDYDLSVYRLNETTYQLEDVSFSQYGPQQSEQVSKIAQPGYYFICVTSYQGFDAVNPFLLRATLTANYDASEPDDTVFYAKPQPLNYSLNGSLDNAFDQDWVKYTVTQSTKANIYLSNSNAANTFKLDIFNANLQGLGSIPQNGSYFAVLPAGTYYFRVNSSNGTFGNYSLNVNAQVNTFDYPANMPSTPNGEDYNSVWNKIKANNPWSYSTNVPLRSIYYGSSVVNGVTQHYWYMEIKYTTSFYYEDIGYIMYNDQYKAHRPLNNGRWVAGFGADLYLSKGVFSDDESMKKYEWDNGHEYHMHYLYDFYYNRDYSFEYHDLNADKPWFTSDKTNNGKGIIYGRAHWFADGSGSNTLVRIDRATGSKITKNDILFATNQEFTNGTMESDTIYTFVSTKNGKQRYRINIDTLAIVSIENIQ